MQSLILSFEAVAPIFLLMLLGYTLKNLKVADKHGFDTVNKLVFKVFLPVLLFYNIYKTETADVFDLKLIVFSVLGVLLVFILGYFAVLYLSRDNSIRGVMLQGFFRSNYAILGVPLVEHICRGGASGLASLMVAVVIPVFSTLAVVALERFRNSDDKLNVQKLLKGIITNPLIIGSVIGLVFFLFGIKLPRVLEDSVADISSVATPLVVIVLGAGFEFASLKGYIREITLVVGVRLVLAPLIMISLAVWLGFTGEALACILVIFASPVAVSSFAMAKQMGGNETLAAQVVVVSSALCLVTLFLWIFALNFMGLF